MAEKLCELRKKGGGGGKYTETSLWTNSAPTSSFSAQAVTLSQSMADFKYLKIKVAPSTTSTSGQYFEDIVLVSELQRTQSSVQEGVRDRLVLGFARTTYDYERPYYYASNTSIYFMATAQAGTSTTSNGRNIPLEILGLNELAHGKIVDYAVISNAVGASNSAPTAKTYTSNSNVFTVSADGNRYSSTITVLEEGLYTYTAIAQVRGSGTASVSIGSQTVASSSTTAKASGEIQISANTVCTASCGNISNVTENAVLILLKKS